MWEFDWNSHHIKFIYTCIKLKKCISKSERTKGQTPEYMTQFVLEVHGSELIIFLLITSRILKSIALRLQTLINFMCIYGQLGTFGQLLFKILTVDSIFCLQLEVYYLPGSINCCLKTFTHMDYYFFYHSTVFFPVVYLYNYIWTGYLS